MGPEHDALEGELADYLGVPHAVACGNGTDALELALRAVGVAPGDFVVSVANAGGYATAAAASIGAKTAYCDVDSSNLLMSRKTLEIALSAIPQPPAAIVVTHLYGALAPVDELVSAARRAGVPLVEDCAQAFGARNPLGKAGTFGAVSTTSFFPTKNLGGLGDGGAVFTRDSFLAERLRRLRQYGWIRKYEVGLEGGRNSRLDELQAALLRLKLRQVDRNNARRSEIFLAYEESFAAVGGHYLLHEGIENFTPHLTVIRSPKREMLRSHFARNLIATEVHYPVPDHLQEPAVKKRPHVPLPNTELASSQVLSIPNFAMITAGEVRQVRKAIESLCP